MSATMTSTHAERYRLVTRSDFDGLVCAALLKHLGILDDILFVHPKDVQDGKVEIGPNDVTTNVPYSPNAAISFDHHHSEKIRVGEDKPNRSEEHTSELQSRQYLVCRLLLEKKNKKIHK